MIEMKKDIRSGPNVKKIVIKKAEPLELVNKKSKQKS